MKECRCLKQYQEDGYIDGRCFLPCNEFIDGVDRMEQEAEKKKAEASMKVDKSVDLKKEALKKIEELYPETYRDRTDYKMIKHNIDE